MKEKKADTVAEHLRATSDKEGQELDIPLHQRLGRARTLTDDLMPRCVLRCGPGSAGGQSTTGAKELRVHRDCATQERPTPRSNVPSLSHAALATPCVGSASRY